MDVLSAIMAAFVASLTGLVAVGRHRFPYSARDLLGGDPLALAYVWVCMSTAASALQATSLLDAAARGATRPGLFELASSIACSLLFAAAHVVVGRWADKRNGAAT